jgi:hypothetical protein
VRSPAELVLSRVSPSGGYVDQIDIDGIVNDLQARVKVRRASGDYPPGLEEQLESQFKIIMAAVQRDEMDTSELGRRIRGVEHSADTLRAQGGTGSRVPGGSTMHSAAARLVTRHTAELATSVRALGIEISGALSEVHHLLNLQREADERQLMDVIGAVMDRLAVLDHLADSVVQLERRVDALEASSIQEQ